MLQEGSAGGYNVIQVGSTGISSAQRNYSVYKLELCGLTFAAKKCYHFIASNPFPIQYFSDNAALKGLENVWLDEERNPHILRLLEDLLSADFTVSYVKSADNSVADYLSRLFNNTSDAPDYPRLSGLSKPWLLL